MEEVTAIAVRGVTIAPRGQWIWLRMYSDDGKQQQSLNQAVVDLCVGKTPLPCTAFDAILPFRVQQNVPSCIRVELWTAATADAAFMQFGGSCCIDAASWTSGEGTERWYELEAPVSQKKTAWTQNQPVSSTYHRATPANGGMGGCVRVKAMFVRRDAKPPPHATASLPVADENTDFRFIVPHKAIRQRASLRRLNIREVMEQTKGGVLEEFLATTLYGNTLAEDSSELNDDLGIRQAMTLLQLSCQYALYSTSELERNTSEREIKIDAMHRRMLRLRRSRTKLDERRSSLARERDVLDCALDGMKVLLHEFNPENIKAVRDHKL